MFSLRGKIEDNTILEELEMWSRQKPLEDTIN